MRTLVIVPTYNEIENIRNLTQDILSVTPEDSHILIVDDNSPDGTGALADVLAKENQRIHVMHRPGKMGLGPAYVAGFKWGLDKGFEFLIEMDADFSHHPRYLTQMIELGQNFDGVIGSRYVEGGGTRNWGLGRRLISKGGSFYARVILGVKIRDLTGGFNGWRRKVLEKINIHTLSSSGYSFQIEIKHRALLNGFRLKEFPIVFEDRKVGHSKMSRKVVFEALSKVWSFRLHALRSNPASKRRLH